MLTYVTNIVEKGALDVLERLPENVILKIISNLELEDISRLSQVNTYFRQLCRSDRVWQRLYKQYYSTEFSKELIQLAERDGWRKLFFTNKIKLQVFFILELFIL
jgi:F-box protein 36